ncbi:MAG: hypothetical protein ACYCPT_04065 [Acidimicrobiales bacterium]
MKLPPGRDGPPLRAAPLLGRAPIGRGPLEGPRPGALDIGRRTPGGGGIGRPLALSGRPGGGGIGRPLALSGGFVGSPPSPVPPRCVGRIVVGPSGETVRVGVGFTGGALERTTLGETVGGAVSFGAGAPTAVVAGSVVVLNDDSAFVVRGRAVASATDVLDT